MRLHHVVVCIFIPLSCALAVAAERPSPPECALDCQQEALRSTACSDTTCLCADKNYQAALSSCTTANCTVQDALLAKYVDSRECGLPITQRYPEADGGTIFPFAVATILFALRIAAKSLQLGGGWGADDYTITIAYFLAITVFSVNISMIHYGFGRNIWDIYPQQNITKAYKLFYAFVLAYKALMSLAKISVCLFLLRIFQSTVFRRTAYAIIGINAAIAITWMLVDSFHCIPVHLAWTQWQGLEQGKCIDFTAATFANGCVNIAIDAIMVVMPLYEVLKLNLSRQKKIGVALMFASGLILTVIGVIRVVIFSQNSSNKNPTYEMQALNRWSVIECQIAITCACLPATRPMLVRFFPNVLGASTGQASTGHPHKYREPSEAELRTGPLTHKSSISKTVSYSVDYGSKSQRRLSNGFTPLTEVESNKG
ncbi:hypothetical protein BJX61DRAFT_549774 [Aspergillus egyptiacus]|nr:hypothetical protein BJX61DRAFT_549774 [Aspergillus egyptiacus]